MLLRKEVLKNWWFSAHSAEIPTSYEHMMGTNIEQKMNLKLQVSKILWRRLRCLKYVRCKHFSLDVFVFVEILVSRQFLVQSMYIFKRGTLPCNRRKCAKWKTLESKIAMLMTILGNHLLVKTLPATSHLITILYYVHGTKPILYADNLGCVQMRKIDNQGSQTI